MELPVIDFTAGHETYGNRDGISKTKPTHEFDKIVDVNEFLRRTVTDTDEARREEIAHIQDRAYHQKQALNRNIASLKNQLLQIENSLSRSSDISAQLNAEKKKASASRELKQSEQSLFLDGMRVDVEAEEVVKQLTEQAKLTADVKRQFVIQITGGNG
jgi:hypothetical protein